MSINKNLRARDAEREASPKYECRGCRRAINMFQDHTILGVGGYCRRCFFTGALSLETAPIGTKAPATMGGYWERVERGWKWCTGATFPRPGADWTGTLVLPEKP